MNIDQALKDLKRERAVLDQIITLLLEFDRMKNGRPTPPEVASTKSKRGRKFMAASERLEVSRRMTEYWAKRRPKQA